MNPLQIATYRLAQACNGNPVSSTVVVSMFAIAFNLVEAQVERLLFGAPFAHALDPVIGIGFIGYAAYAVYWCAVFNSRQHQAESGKDGA